MTFALLSVLTVVASIALFLVLKARHRNENERFLMAEAERLVAWFFGLIFFGGLVFVTLRYS